jgi:hypothetical protein
MNIDIDENDCIVVETKGSDVGKRSAGLAGSKNPADAAASAPSSELGKVAVEDRGGWTRVTRQRGRGTSRVSTGEPAAKIVKVFASTGEPERKRKAEEGITEQVAELKELVYRLLESNAKQETKRDAQQEELAATIEAQAKTITGLETTIQRQSEELKEIKALLGPEQPGRKLYSEVVHRAPSSVSSGSTTTTLVDGEPSARRRQDEDETAITINTIRVKKEKQDTTAMLETFNQSLRSFKATEGIEIQYIRLRQPDSADLVFSSTKDRDRAREHPRWLTSTMPEARMRGEQWYPVKCDCVAKDVVMDLEKDDSKTLRPGLLLEFKEQNSTDTIDCTAMKATWLSKRHPGKRVGSLVIWLKKPAAAEHLIRQGTALFGASGSYCCKFERRDGFDLCYNCNRYGHKQVTCTHPTRCGICSGPHNTRNCSQRATPKCPACTREHPIFDRSCKFHPLHVAATTQPSDAGRNGKQGNGRSSKQKPVFGPSLPPSMAKERRQASVEADETMTGV